MSKKSPEQKLEQKRQDWLSRTSEALSIDNDSAMELLRTNYRQSVRINSLAGDPKEILSQMKDLGWQGESYEWLDVGYTIEEGYEELRDSNLIKDGKVYIQNAASWLTALAVDPMPGDRILDLCAAPGGKTTHIAALANNQAEIVANDNSKERLHRLRANCHRMGANIERYTLFDATSISKKLDHEQFDKIMIDAPCSGEGMMQYDRDKDFATWSTAHIKRLRSLQKSIVTQAWKLLKPGGTLVYSTCTMAPEENEVIIDYALRALSGAKLETLDFRLDNRVSPVTCWNDKKLSDSVKGCLRLKPSRDIEAFFVAKLIKLDGSNSIDDFAYRA